MEVNRRDHAAIDITSLTSSLLEATLVQNSSASSRCSVFQVPSILFRHNKNAFLPDAFSIGPLHHGKPHLEATEKIKLQYLQGLLSRTGTSLHNFISAISEIRDEARSCYAVSIEFSDEEFVKILLVDAVFIIELLRKDIEEEAPKDIEDPIFSMSCMLQFLYHDLILLENQIPWQVLERLFNMTCRSGRYSLVQLALNFFGNIFSLTPPEVGPNHGSKHILDLLRQSLVSSLGAKESGVLAERWQLIPSATSLVEAGIKFKRSTSKSILDIKFNDGVLEIPPLLIQETTEAVLRNLLSFEQCDQNCAPRVTSYAVLLNNLIRNNKDMDVLCQNKIIDTWLNPEEAVHFFSELYQDTFVKEFYYLNLCKDVSGFCERNWPRWRAIYVRNYFSTPWAIASQVFAASILILAVLQTFYSIKR